ncbi:MAG: MFS transporter [Actinobacteria bacterium]|nr:MFS transporter [Actinomycetota bacterium]
MKLTSTLPRLPKSADFRRVWIATIISQLGDWSARLAIGVLVYERTGRPSLVGAAALVFIAPYLGLGQILTARAERYQRRNVMLAADSFRAICFLGLGLGGLPILPLLLLLFVAASVDPVYEAQSSALIIEVAEDEYDAAIRFSHISKQTAQMAGLGVGGLLIAFMSPEVVLLVDAGTFVVAALIVRGVAARRHTPAESLSVRATLAGGFSFLRRDQTTRNAVIATMITVGAGVAVEGQVAVLGPELAGWTGGGIGALAMATPIGSIVAMAIVSTKGSDVALYYRSLIVSLGAAAVVAALVLAGKNGAVLLLAFFALGFMFQASMAANILVGKRIPADNRSTVFGLLQALILVASGVGAYAGGVAIEWLGPTVGVQAMMVTSATAVLFVVPRQTRRVISGPEGATSRRGEQLTSDEVIIDLRDPVPVDDPVGHTRSARPQ